MARRGMMVHRHLQPTAAAVAILCMQLAFPPPRPLWVFSFLPHHFLTREEETENPPPHFIPGRFTPRPHHQPTTRPHQPTPLPHLTHIADFHSHSNGGLHPSHRNGNSLLLLLFGLLHAPLDSLPHNVPAALEDLFEKEELFP
jgi:hypothetical protein